MDPSDPESHHAYSHFLLSMGRVEESLAESRRALEIDPLNAGMRGHLVLHYLRAHDFASALDAAKATRDIDPGASDGWIYGRMAYEGTGQFDEAIKMREGLGEPSELIHALRLGLATAGPPGLLAGSTRQRARKIETRVTSALEHTYARLGQHREAMEWLERAFREREGWLIYLNSNVNFDGLRADPHFQDLIKRLGLPERRYPQPYRVPFVARPPA